MTSVSLRNQFIIQNYKRLLRISIICSRKIYERFPMLSKNDIQGYAFEGIIAALDKADLSNEKVFSYVFKYAYSDSLRGALQMLGIKRYRSRERSTYTELVQVACDPQELNEYIEANQEIPQDRYEAVQQLFYEQEIDWILSRLNHSIEKIILIHVLQEKRVNQIARDLKMSPRQVRRIIIKLQSIWAKAVRNKPIDSLLTPYELRWVPIKLKRLEYDKIDFRCHPNRKLHGCRIKEFFQYHILKKKK